MAPLDFALLARIGDLEYVARTVVDGLVSGLHRSPFHGFSAEFQQYRHYRPGDDLKYVDWKLFARTDRYFTKQFRETTNLAAMIALDRSASMAFASRAGPSKLTCGVIVAAALAYLISRQGDAVGLAAFDDRVAPYVAPRAGPVHLRGLLGTLAGLTASGSTSAASALRQSTDLLRRRGLLLVISDLYDDDEEGVMTAVRRAARMGHDVAVLHLVSRAEVDWTFRAETEFVDLETERSVLLDPRLARAAYQRSFRAFLDRWQRHCIREGVSYTRVSIDDPLDASLRPFLIQRSVAAVGT